MTASASSQADLPHVARLRLPAHTAAEVIWGPGGHHAGTKQPKERWLLRWTARQLPAPGLAAPTLQGPVVSIGLNPSGAGADAGDMTLNTEWALYQRWGRTQLVKLNLFSFIATLPIDLLWYSGGDTSYAAYVVAKATELHREGGLVLATWGGVYRPSELGQKVQHRAAEILDGLKANGVPVHVLGLTGSGQPRHIRGIGRNVQPQLWRAAA